jgi:hypothetical protein
VRVENPFFRLAVLLARRAFSNRQLALGALLTLTAAPVFAVVVMRSFWGWPGSISGWWIAAPHALMVAALAAADAGAFLRDELRRGTFEGVLLLPWRARGLLALRAMFPVWSLLVHWAAGLPVYLAAAVLDLLPFSAALPFSVLPLYAGGIMLLIQAAYSPILGADGQVLPGEKLGGRSLVVTTTLISLFLAGLMLLGGARRVGVFAWLAPAWGLVAALTVALVIAGTAAAHASLQHDERAQRRSSLAVTWAGCFTSFTTLGLFWRWLPWWISWPLLAIGAVAAVITLVVGYSPSFAGPSVTDGGDEKPASAGAGAGTPAVKPVELERTRAEIAWFDRRWENPLLVRDLRARCRTTSLRSTLLTAIVWGGVWTVLLLAGWYFFRGFFGRSPFILIMWLLVSPLMNWVGAAGAEAEALWKRERERNTLAALAMSPLTSAELLRGRLIAALAGFAANSAPSLLLIAGATVWVSVTFWWGAAPAVVLALSLAPALAVMRGCNPGVTVGKRLSRRPFLLQVIAIVVSLLVGGLAWLLPWPATWGLVLGAGAFNLCITRVWFDCRVGELDAVRRGEGNLF